MKNQLKYITLILLCLMSWITTAQEPSHVESVYHSEDITIHAFDKTKWEKAKEGIDYSPKQQEQKKQKKEKKKESQDYSWDRNYGDWSIKRPTVGASTFQVVLFILVLGLLSWLGYKYLGGVNLSMNNEEEDAIGAVDIVKVEKNLHKSDLERLIEKAQSNKEYAMSIRLYYLWAIKELSKKKYIRWKRDKTNRDYSRELRNSPFQQQFRSVTRIFERVWYGNKKQLSAQDYELLKPTMLSFVQSIQQSKDKKQS